MNREIKFRAWITRYADEDEKGRMYYLEPFKNWYDCEDGFLLGFSVDGYAGIGAHECCEEDTKEVDYDIMQFICYKDKDENDIYEGDIVECNRYDTNESHTVIITDIRNLPNELFGSNLNWRKIIGNIYENPELIK
jgi:ribosomal protein L35AE/L33A